MKYTLKTIKDKGNGHEWIVEGLIHREYDYDTHTENDKPDTCLILVGMNHSCDTSSSVAASVYECLYGEYQCNTNLVAGDTIESEATKVYKYHSYSGPMLKIPAMKFVCDGVDVLPADRATHDLIEGNVEKG